MTIGKTIIGTFDNDDLHDTDGDDIIYGLFGHDYIYTYKGNDTVYGGDQNDRIFNNDGNDLLDGGAGRDTINFAMHDSYSGGPGHGITFDLRKTVQTVGDFGTDTYVGFENVFGTEGGDTIHGDTGTNRLWGGSGDDNLFGHAGDDLIEGNGGADIIVGGAGADTLGGDSFYTNSYDGGSDMYRYLAISDSGATAGSRDTIWGHFSSEGAVKGDMIDLTGIDANPYAKGNQGFKFVGSFTEGQVGELRVQFLAEDIYLVSLDNDHDNGAEMQIVVHSATMLTASDFYL